MRGIRLPETRRARVLRRAATSAERKIWGGSRGRGLGAYKFVRQEPVGPYYADFVCREARLIVEIDGATHSTDELAGEKRREDFLGAQGDRVIRFTNADVYEQVDRVFEAIFPRARAGQSMTPASWRLSDWPLTLPLPARGERGGRRRGYVVTGVHPAAERMAAGGEA